MVIVRTRVGMKFVLWAAALALLGGTPAARGQSSSDAPAPPGAAEVQNSDH